MKHEIVKKQLLEGARRGEICADGYRRMFELDVDGLVDYYLENPDWCLERNFPDMQTLRDHFTDLGNKGVFIDREFHGEVLNDLQVYVFHNCKGTVKVGLNLDKEIIPMLYFANGCRMRLAPINVTLTRNAVRVPVYVFGANDISAHSNRYVDFIMERTPLI